MPGLLIKILKPPEKYRVGSFRDSIDYARGAVHDDDRDRVPERDIDGQMPAREDGHRGQLIAMQGVTSVDHAAIEMDAIADMSRAADSVLHLVLSYGGQVDPDCVALDARRMLAVLGASEHQFVLFGHNDKSGNYHAHLIGNRTHPTTHKAIHMSHSYARMECEATRINHARGWRIIPGQWNGRLIDQLVNQERDQITNDSRSLEEKIDDLEKIRAANRSRHRPQTASAKRLPIRTPRGALDIRQKRLRPMPGRELVYPEGSTQPILPRDVGLDARSSRRLRTLEAGYQRAESRGSGVIPADLQGAARERGELPGAVVLGPVIHAAIERRKNKAGQDDVDQKRVAFQNFVEDLFARGISTRIKIDIEKKSQKRLPKISFARDGLALSGSQIGLKASALEAEFGELDASWSTDTRPPVAVRIPDDENEIAIAKINEKLVGEYRRYEREALDARRTERDEIRKQYREKLEIDRAKEIKKLERTLRLKLLAIEVLDAVISDRRRYRGRRIGFSAMVRETLRQRTYKAHWRRVNAVEADYRAKRRRVPDSAYTPAQHSGPVTYLDWLRLQPVASAITQVIATISASRFSRCNPLLPSPRLPFRFSRPMLPKPQLPAPSTKATRNPRRHPLLPKPNPSRISCIRPERSLANRRRSSTSSSGSPSPRGMPHDRWWMLSQPCPSLSSKVQVSGKRMPSAQPGLLSTRDSASRMRLARSVKRQPRPKHPSDRSRRRR